VPGSVVTGPVLSLVASAAGGVELLREQLVEPLLDQGWRVAITLTPTAAEWLSANGELAKLVDVTGMPVRHAARLPGEVRPHPSPDCIAVVPASANTLAKLALGLADNQALTHVCEAIGEQRVPVVVFPRVNAAHVRQPAWSSHIAALRSVGVHLVYGAEVWPLHEPRSAPGRQLPWSEIRQAITTAKAVQPPQ
jgi:3-polyprenyl-4-hydroxybenzoate decarboxylase